MKQRPEATPFGRLLRRRRTQRRATQEWLAFRAGLSTRHVSFLETGRSNPSRSSVLALAGALELPLRDRNALLRAAGFAPQYPERDVVRSEGTHIRTLLSFLLRRHEPFPAYVVDRSWTVRRHNDGAASLMNWLLGRRWPVGEGSTVLEGTNLLLALFDPHRLRPLTVNFDEVGRFLVGRLEHEMALRPDDERLRELLRVLESYGPLPEASPRMPREPGEPALSINLRKDEVEVRLLSFIMTVAAPLDVGLEEIRMETFLPADPESEALLRKVASDRRGGAAQASASQPAG